MTHSKFLLSRRSAITGGLSLIALAACSSRISTVAGTSTSAPGGASGVAFNVTRIPVPGGKIGDILGSAPVGLGIGPDDTVWFTTIKGRTVGRVTAEGGVSQFPVEEPSSPHRLAAGPDGNMWFTNFAGNRVGRITPAGVITEFTPPSVPNVSIEEVMKKAGRFGAAWFGSDALPKPTNAPFGICAGPDNSMWFTEFLGNRIGRITMDGKFTEWDVPTPVSGPNGITMGPDGNLWFCENFGNKIARMTPSGEFTEWDVPTKDETPSHLTVGPDNALWFCMPMSDKIGRISLDGKITEFSIAEGPEARHPREITRGPDGALWFSEFRNGTIGRITTDGKVSHFGERNPRLMPFVLAFDSKGVLWWTETVGGNIARMEIGKS